MLEQGTAHNIVDSFKPKKETVFKPFLHYDYTGLELTTILYKIVIVPSRPLRPD